MILTEKVLLDDLIANSNNYFPDRIKFCIDKKEKIISIDEQYHVDMEGELINNGSREENIFGGDIVFIPEISIVWEAHPNINRNIELGTGRGRLLSDEMIKQELFDILKLWIL